MLKFRPHHACENVKKARKRYCRDSQVDKVNTVTLKDFIRENYWHYIQIKVTAASNIDFYKNDTTKRGVAH